MTTADQRISLDDYLALLPADVLLSASGDSGETRRIISGAFVREIGSSLRAPDAVAKRLAPLSEEAFRTIMLCCLAGRSGLPADGLSPDLRQELVRSFIVCVAHTPENRPVLLSFPDLIAEAGSALAAAWAQRWSSTGAPTPVTRLATAPAADLAVLLCTVLAAPLPVNREGEPARQTVNALRRALHVRHIPAVLGDYKDAKVVIDCMLSFARHEGIVYEAGGCIRATREQVEHWLTRDPETVVDAMRTFAATRDGAFDPDFSRALLNAVGETSLRLPDGLPRARWEQMAAQVCCMAWLGEVAADDTTGDIRFAPNTGEFWKPVADASVTILPDYSAIVPQEAPLPTIGVFHRCGAFTALDRIYKGTITRDAVTSALCAGYSQQTILAALETFKAPQNVLLSAHEWMREFSRVSIVHAATVVVSDERTGSQIANAPALAEVLEEVECARLFRVRPGQESRVETLLASMGFDPRHPDTLGPDRNAAGTEASGAPSRLVIQSDLFTRNPVGTAAVASGKYSAELKVLDTSDMIHVMDYAILMGNRLRLDVDTFPGVKAGEYVVSPKKMNKVPEASLESMPEGGKAARIFPIKKILRIAVVYD